ncbi:MAG: ATP-binding cassette domain-containing protein [Candidatus Schekmanbacteria bacterium]|nr:MAG: ATP-binding cassette domain-containing protein [Candidatus Schekmanbacteria bacterium]
MAEKRKSFLKVDAVTFSYKNSKMKQLNNISFTIGEGEFVAILGKSGAGKSTLLLTLNGLIPLFIKGEFSGSVYLNEMNISESSLAETSQKVGIVFQDFESQLFSTSVDLEVAFGLENLGIGREEIEKSISNYLALTGLSGFENRQPAMLSGGEKQRLAIASMLAMEPRLICLDEPTTDLDPEGKESIFSLMKKIKEDNKRTIVAVEHETDELLYADRCIVLEEGKIVADECAEEIFKRIDFLESHGIMPPQLAELSQITNSKKIFRNEEEAVQWINEIGYEIDYGAFSKIKKEEEDYFRKVSNSEPEIQLDNVSFAYNGKNYVLNNVSNEFKKGEITAIAGGNGSGKTTLIKHFNGLLKPTKGTVKLKGKDISGYNSLELAQRAGFVFQNPDCQIFSETVRAEVEFTPKLLGLSKKAIEERVDSALRAVGLSDFAEYDPFVLTKGERQKIAVASVLAAQSNIIILDEPTTGLDYNELKGMMNLLLALNKKGHTIIMVTHSMYVISNYAQRLIIMKNGEAVFDGKTRDAFENEKILSENHIKMPAVCKISAMLGCRVKNLEEFKKVFKINKYGR